MSVASTIYGQLGGRRFAVMTGAKNFVSSENALTFRFPKAKNKSNAMRITLNDLDLYDIEFLWVYNLKVTSREKLSNVYAEDLVSVFEDKTGFYTSL